MSANINGIFLSMKNKVKVQKIVFKDTYFYIAAKKMNIKYCPVPKHEARCHCLCQCVFMFYKQYKALFNLHLFYVYNDDVKRLWFLFVRSVLKLLTP